MNKRIVIFDCDHTFTSVNPTFQFLLLLRGFNGLIFDLICILPDLIFSFLSNESEGIFIKTFINKSIQNSSRKKLKHVLHELLPRLLIRKVRKKALSRLFFHKKKGDRVFLATSSPEPFVASLANYFEIELIATKTTQPLIVTAQNKFQLLSANCKGFEKLNRLKAYLSYLPSAKELEVYGDSPKDKELLLYSKYPHYRSYSTRTRPYREYGFKTIFISLLSLLLLTIGTKGVLSLDPIFQKNLSESLLKLIFWIPLIYFILLVSYLGRYIRWRILLSYSGIGKLGLKDLIAWFGGFVLSATPGKIGELSRIQQLNDQLNYPRKPLLNIFFIERICDIGAVIFWLIIFSPSTLKVKLNSLLNSSYIFIFLFFLSLFIFVIYFISRKNINRFLDSNFPRFNIKYIISITNAFILSIFFWATESIILFLLVAILSDQSISFAGSIIIFLISGTAGIVSTIPGGLGVNEAATAFMLQQYDIPLMTSISIAILRRMFTIWSITLLSLITTIAFKKFNNVKFLNK